MITNQFKLNDVLQSIAKTKRNPILYSKPGYILRVEIKGFLTHINKTIDIKNVIQLIFGPNGSGKSSILESIVFCLCGEKNHIRQNLDQLQSLKTQAGLITSAEDKEDVAIIKQTSVTVYFAKPLAIRRIITEKDASVYQICYFTDDKTKFKKISKQNVINILHQLNHYPNNRVTMVNQQEMKQLARMQPNERYNLFSDASGLSDVMFKMKCALEDIEKIKDTIQQCQQLRNKLKEQYRDIDQKWKDAQILREQQEILLKQQLKQESCLFGQKYIELRVQTNKEQQLIQQYTQQNQEYQITQQKYNEASKNSDKLKNEIEIKKQQRSQLYDKQNQAQINYSNLMRELQNQKYNIDITNDRIENVTKQIEQSQSSFKKHQKIVNQYQQQQPLIQPVEPQELLLLRDECKQLNQDKNNLNQRIIQYQRQEQDIKQQYTNILSIIEIQNNKMEELNQELAITNQNIINTQQNLTLQKSMIKTLQTYNKQFINHDFTHLKYGILPYFHVYVKKSHQQYGQLIRSMIQPETLQQLVYLQQNEQQFNYERDKIDQHHIFSDVKYYKIVQQKNIKDEIQKHQELNNVKITIVMDCLQFTNSLALQHLIVKSNIDQICITDTREHAYLIAGLIPNIYVYCEQFQTYLYNNNGQIDSNKNRNYQKGAQIYIDDDSTIESFKRKVIKIQQEINVCKNQLQNQEQKKKDLNYDQQISQINQQIKNLQQSEKQYDIQLQEKQQLRDQQQQNFDRIMIEYNKEYNRRQAYRNEYEHALTRIQKANDEIKIYQQELQKHNNKLEQLEQQTQQLENQCQNIDQEIQQYKSQAQQLSLEIRQSTQMLESLSQNKIQQILLDLQEQLQSIQEKIKIQQQKIQEQTNNLEQFSQQLFQKLQKIQSDSFKQVSNQLQQVNQVNQYFDNCAIIIAQFVYIHEEKEKELQNIVPSQDLFDKLYLQYQQLISETQQEYQKLQSQYDYNINEIQAKRISLYNKLNDNAKNIDFARKTLQSTTQILGKLIVKVAALRETCRQKICQEFDKEVKLLNLQMALQFNLKPIPKLEDFHLDSSVLEGQDKELYQQLVQSNVSNTTTQDEINIVLKDRDVSTLSGGEQTFTALAFIMSCIQITKSIFFSCDEWDVYLDAERRTKAFEKLVKMISMSDVQTILVTPNDVDLDSVQLTPEEKSLISVERLKGIKRL